MNGIIQKQLGLLLITFLLVGLTACGGGGGGGGSSADPSFKIGTPTAQAVDAGGQPLTLTTQDLVQPTITLSN